VLNALPRRPVSRSSSCSARDRSARRRWRARRSSHHYPDLEDPRTTERGEIVAGGVEAQTRQVFANLVKVLALAGCTLDDVCKVTVWLGDARDFGSRSKRTRLLRLPCAMPSAVARCRARPIPARASLKGHPHDQAVDSSGCFVSCTGRRRGCPR
jgi:enamine deaminase RidA (YjgF/YER057c/UK114 family)